MLSFFPRQFDDEILYSLIARYHCQSGNTIMRETLNDLFNCKCVHSSVVLPARFGILSKNLETFGGTFDDLLINRTLFPFYMAFAQERVVKKVYNWARFSQSGSMCSELGLYTYGSLEPRSLRFCPECYREEKSNLGEGYWHRIHQTPGVLVCERHCCQLLDSHIQYRTQRDNYYYPAHVQNIMPPGIPENLSPEDFRIAVLIAKDVKWLYDNYLKIRGAFPNQNNNFRSIFIRMLMEKGLATDNGSLRIDKYRGSFNRFFGPRILDILNLQVSEDINKAWIIGMCRTSVVPTHPLKYILMAIFLCGSLEKLIDIAIQQNGTQIPNRSRCTEVTEIEIKREKYRARWLGACLAYSKASQNDIRNHIPSVYTWLNRHDKLWLRDNSPSSRKRGGYKKFADWNERDKEYAKKVAGAAERIRAYPGKPVQISILRIGKELGCGELLYSKAKVLPLTMQEVYKAIEDSDTIRMRKIEWAINELNKQGLPIAKWRVMKLAGIRDELWERYWGLIAEDGSIQTEHLVNLSVNHPLQS